ncbi:MAG: DUF309 domain-containing protein [bacterium]|nr:DUF309 domain-containing protein [bacterium]
MKTPERLVPHRPFPAYAFIPGKTPHPVRDPRGHSYGHVPDPAEPLSVKNWRENELYLYGIDLFNHGYYWEAHEAWEDVWNATGHEKHPARFCKALIQFTAVGVKALEGRILGVRTLSKCAKRGFVSLSLELLPPDGRYLGLSLAALIRHTNQIYLASQSQPSAAKAMLGFVLELKQDETSRD